MPRQNMGTRTREAWREFAPDGFQKLWGRAPAGGLQPDPSDPSDRTDRTDRTDPTDRHLMKPAERRIRNPEHHRLVRGPMYGVARLKSADGLQRWEVDVRSGTLIGGGRIENAERRLHDLQRVKEQQQREELLRRQHHERTGR